MNTDEAVSGLFGEVRGTVRNFTLSSSEFKSTATYFGAIVGYGRGNMDTIYVDDTVTIESSASECGGLVGRYGSTSTATISNCWFAGTVTSSAQYCGGIAGRVENGQKSIVNCMSSGTISSAVAVDQVAFAGGMVGGVYSDNGKLTTTFTMNDCLNTAKVDATSPYGVGSVIGRARNIKTVTIEQTYTTNESSSSVGYVTSTSGYVGIGNASAVNKGETDASGSPDNAYAVTGTPILKTDVNLEGAEGYKNTQLNFWVKEGDTGLWVARKNATPALKSFIDKTEWNKDVNLNVQRVHTDWYYNNLNTEEKTYTIGTVAEFYGLAEIVNNDGRTFAADETVYLTNDIVINSGEFNKNTWMKWQPILSFAGTFDGMYEGKIHTISGIYIDETSTTEVGLFRIVTGSIKNLGLKNSYIFSTKNNTGSIAGELRGGQLFNVYSNAKVTGSGQVTGGIIGRVKTTASTLTGCWFDGEVQSSNLAAGGIAGGAIMHVTFKDCLNTGSVTNTVSANAWTGGICGYNNNGGIVTVENCINTGKIIASNTSGAILGRSNVKNGFVVTSAYASSQSCATAYSGNAPATAVTTFDENAYKGIAGTQFSTLNFAAPTETNPIQWVLRTGAVPGVISWTSASEKIVADTTWYDTSDVTLGTTTNPYMLATKEEFYGFAKLAFEGNTFSGKTIQLVNSLTFNGVTENTDVSGWKATPPVDIWIPIKEFAGTFDGQNKTISGIYINESSTAEVGLFRIVTGCIKNFGLKSSYIASTKNNTGSIVGELRGGQLLNVYSNAKVTSSGQVTGGIIGRVKTTASTLTGCWFDGEVEASNLAAGGIAGGAIMHVTFKDCLNTGSVTNTISANAWTGGICGYNNNGAVVTIENCINTGIITASNTCGSILGQSNVNNGFKTTNVYASTQSCAVTHSGKAPSTTIATFDEELYKESEGTKFSTLNFATPTVENPIQWVLRKDAIPGLADWTPSSDKLVTNTN